MTNVLVPTATSQYKQRAFGAIPTCTSGLLYLQPVDPALTVLTFLCVAREESDDIGGNTALPVTCASDLHARLEFLPLIFLVSTFVTPTHLLSAQTHTLPPQHHNTTTPPMLLQWLTNPVQPIAARVQQWTIRRPITSGAIAAVVTGSSIAYGTHRVGFGLKGVRPGKSFILNQQH